MMAFSRSELRSGESRLQMDEHPDLATVVNYLRFLNSFLQAKNIHGDTLNNNHEDLDVERRAMKRRLGQKLARQSERHRKPPEYQACFPHPLSDWELTKSDETPSVTEFKDATKQSMTHPELSPILFPAAQSLTHWYSYYAKIILQAQLQQQQRQIHKRHVLEHLFANQSEVSCSNGKPERPSEKESLQNCELKVRTRVIQSLIYKSTTC